MRDPAKIAVLPLDFGGHEEPKNADKEFERMNAMKRPGTSRGSWPSIALAMVAAAGSMMGSCATRSYNSNGGRVRSETPVVVGQHSGDRHVLLALPALQYSTAAAPRKGYYCFYHAKVDAGFADRDKVTPTQWKERLRAAYDAKKIRAIIPGTSLWSALTFWKKKEHEPVTLAYLNQRLSIIQGEAELAHMEESALAEHLRLTKQLSAKLGAFSIALDAETRSDASLLVATSLNASFEQWDGSIVKFGVEKSIILQNSHEAEAQAASGAKESLEELVGSDAPDRSEPTEGNGAPKQDARKGRAADFHEFKLLKRAIERKTPEDLSAYNILCPDYKDFYNLKFFD